VDFDLSDDQLDLRKAAATLLDSMAAPSQVRAVAGTKDHFDRDLWAAMAEQGWLSVDMPEADGGLGLGRVEVAVLGEELGRRLAPVPFLGTNLALGALRRGVDSALAASATTLGDTDLAGWIERLGAGEAVGALAWSSTTDAPRATERAGSWTVSGRTDPVVYAPAADVVVSCAATEQGQLLFALAPDARRRPDSEPAMDHTRAIARLVWEEEPAVCLGGPGDVEAVIDLAAAALSAEMLGAADQVLQMTVGYAKDRVQFGRPIGSFQAVKHRCADMLVDVEGMRSAAYYAAWAVGAGDPEASTAASAAKVWCSDASRRVMASALQVHGGIGFTWEHDLHLFLKRAQLDQVSFGDARYHRERIARILRPRAEAGLPVF